MSLIEKELQALMNVEKDEDVSILTKIQGKPGLDQEEGLYRIDGGLVIDKVQYRATTGRNIAKTVGLKITRIEWDEEGNTKDIETLCVTKDEAVDLVTAYGSVNSYVKTNVSRKNNTLSYHVQPFPAREEAFTTDERLVFVYEIDSNGSKVRPFNLLLDEKECSMLMWIEIRADYDKRKERDRKLFRGKSKEEVKRNEIMKGQIRARRVGYVPNIFKED